MGKGIKSRRQKPPGQGAKTVLLVALDEAAPKDLFAWSDNESQEKDDPERRSLSPKGVDIGDSGKGKRKNRPGDIIACIKDEIKQDGAKDPEKNFFCPSGIKISDEERKIRPVQGQAERYEESDVGAHQPPKIDGPQPLQGKKQNKKNRGKQTQDKRGVF